MENGLNGNKDISIAAVDGANSDTQTGATLQIKQFRKHFQWHVILLFACLFIRSSVAHSPERKKKESERVREREIACHLMDICRAERVLQLKWHFALIILSFVAFMRIFVGHSFSSIVSWTCPEHIRHHSTTRMMMT